MGLVFGLLYTSVNAFIKVKLFLNILSQVQYLQFTEERQTQFFGTIHAMFLKNRKKLRVENHSALNIVLAWIAI